MSPLFYDLINQFINDSEQIIINQLKSIQLQEKEKNKVDRLKNLFICPVSQEVFLKILIILDLHRNVRSHQSFSLNPSYT